MSAPGCYIGVFSAQCSQVEADVQIPIPRSGTIMNFVYQGFGGASVGAVITLRVNGVPTGITCMITATSGCTDLTHSVPMSSVALMTVASGTNTTKPGAWTAQIF